MSIVWNLPGTCSLWDPAEDGPECAECGTYEIDDESIKMLDDGDWAWPERPLCAECRADEDEAPTSGTKRENA